LNSLILRLSICQLAWLLLITVLGLQSAFADESSVACYSSDTEEPNSYKTNPAECVKQGEWNFALSTGLGVRTNPLYQSDNIPLLLLPEISYYGDIFFIQNLDFGLTLYESNNSTVNLLAAPSYDGVFFNQWDPGNLFFNISGASSNVSGAQGITLSSESSRDYRATVDLDDLNTRKFSYLAGLEFNHHFEEASLQLNLLSDISGIHNGNEIRLAFSQPVTSNLTASIGFNWKSQKLTNYYYGVSDQEVDSSRASYNANASFNPYFRLGYKIPSQIAKNWRISLEYQRLGQTIVDSPIVAESNVVTFFIGKRFEF
jgi:outer membrane protein